MTQRDNLRRWARTLSRAVDTPLSGARVPANAAYLHRLAKLLERLADGETVSAVFRVARPVGRPSQKARAFEYWACRAKGLSQKRSAKAACAKFPDVPAANVATIVRHARRYRNEAKVFNTFEILPPE